MKLVPLLCALALVAAPAFANEQKAEMKVNKYLPMMDTDNDGRVSMSEHEAFGRKKFSEADTNKDNMLSKQEMIAIKSKEMKDMDHSKDMDDSKKTSM